MSTKNDVFESDEQGVMHLAGHDVRELVREYETPLIVLLEENIRRSCRAYKEALGDDPGSRVYYASKAFLTNGFCHLIEEEGLGLDVASPGELHTALSAGFPPADILMHGNAKTEAELRSALAAGVGRIVIDNHDEITRLSDIAQETGTRANVLIRVTPGVRPSTHRYVQTGQLDSKFGFNLEGGSADQAVQEVLSAPGLLLRGLHCHIGSQILAQEPFEAACRAVMKFYASVKSTPGSELEELNMGGGLGIRYEEEDQPVTVQKHLQGLARVVRENARRLDIPAPRLCDEPGRSIIGRAGVTLYTVQSTKRIPGVRNYVSVDGGMTDNPRHALYSSRHRVVAATRLGEPAAGLWSVSGRCCESGDMLARDVELPEPAVGDLLAILSTGAYTYSMASNYNRVARPAVVLAAPGRVGLLARRESLDDLIDLDEVPSWLNKESR